MRIVLQRVSSASVDVVDDATGEQDPSFTPQSIKHGYVLLVGVSDDDSETQAEWITHKIANLRVFEDADGKMNRSLLDVGGEILSISQFTLFGDVKKGNRPSFVTAGRPEHAQPLWLRLSDLLRAEGITVKEGRFGAHMRVSLVNDGPVTITIDTAALGR